MARRAHAQQGLRKKMVSRTRSSDHTSLLPTQASSSVSGRGGWTTLWALGISC